jgi:hypothetical protein
MTKLLDISSMLKYKIFLTSGEDSAELSVLGGSMPLMRYRRGTYS